MAGNEGGIGRKEGQDHVRLDRLRARDVAGTFVARWIGVPAKAPFAICASPMRRERAAGAWVHLMRGKGKHAA